MLAQCWPRGIWLCFRGCSTEQTILGCLQEMRLFPEMKQSHSCPPRWALSWCQAAHLLPLQCDSTAPPPPELGSAADGTIESDVVSSNKGLGKSFKSFPSCKNSFKKADLSQNLLGLERHDPKSKPA